MTAGATARPRIAVILPCYNEEAAIGATVAAFRLALPDAAIHVYDNNSTDGTRAAATAAGAIVRCEPMQGKGHVVRRMFADVEADIYVMADGDATYDAAAAPVMVARLIDERLDMVVGARASEVEAAYRRGHRFGNAMLTSMLARIFGRSFSDILSGYRVFSRRFVKSFPVLSTGFEIETEISVHALELRLPVGEVVTRYGARPAGSASKLSTYADGWRILGTIVTLARIERPVAFFGAIGALLALAAVVLAVPLALTYAQTGLVPRFPHRDPRHRTDDPRLPVPVHGADPRYGGAGPARGAAAGLSGAGRARRRPLIRSARTPMLRPSTGHEGPQTP